MSWTIRLYFVTRGMTALMLIWFKLLTPKYKWIKIAELLTAHLMDRAPIESMKRTKQCGGCADYGTCGNIFWSISLASQLELTLFLRMEA